MRADVSQAVARLALAFALLACAGCLDWPSLYEAGLGCDEQACDAAVNPIDGADACVRCDAGSTPEGCGNGKLEPGEQCDDGNHEDRDGCLASCQWATCGDGIVRTGVEECDDANDTFGDGCNRCLACAVDADTFEWSVNGSCYDLHSDMPLSRDEASSFCATGSMAALLMINLNDEEIVVDEAVHGAAQQSFWLGMSRHRDGFFWLSGENLGRTFWGAGEPAARPNDCAIETVDAMTDAGVPTDARDYNWHACKCDEAHSFICERSPPALRSETNHAYAVGLHRTTWADARDRCAALGAHLATIDSEAEHGFAAVASFSSVWLGGLRDPTDFTWITGEPFTYQRFSGTDYPEDDADQKCLLLNWDDLWYDKKCDDLYGYLCEFE
jgi:cysteine-rich repeat protein